MILLVGIEEEKVDTTRKGVCDGVLFKKWAREERMQEKNAWHMEK